MIVRNVPWDKMASKTSGAYEWGGVIYMEENYDTDCLGIHEWCHAVLEGDYNRDDSMMKIANQSRESMRFGAMRNSFHGIEYCEDLGDVLVINKGA